MKPTYNPLLQLVPNRITKLRQQLAGKLWRDFENVPVFGGPVNGEFLSLDEGMNQPMRTVPAGELFGQPTGAWQQRWFRLDIPVAKTATSRFLHWDCNGETTVYFDGKPYAGLDVAHSVILVPAKGLHAVARLRYLSDLRVASGAGDRYVRPAVRQREAGHTG